MRPVDQIVDDIAGIQTKLNELETKKKILVEELRTVSEFVKSALSGLE